MDSISATSGQWHEWWPKNVPVRMPRTDRTVRP